MSKRPEHWWKARPDWLDALYHSDSEQPLEWLSETSSHELRQESQAEEGDLPLARLPMRSARHGYRSLQPTLWVDASRPEQLWIVVAPGLSKVLWIGCGTSQADFDKMWAPYSLATFPDRFALERHHRVVLNTDNSYDDCLDAIFGHWAADTLMWGSSFEDPWPMRYEGNLFKARADRDHYNQQLENAFPCYSARSLLSGSIVSVTSVVGFIMVDVYFDAVADGVADALHEEHVFVPPQMPVDALAMMLAAGEPLQEEQCEQLLAEHPDALALRGHLMVHRHDDLGKLQKMVRTLASGDEEAQKFALATCRTLELHHDLLAMLSHDISDDLCAEIIDLFAPQPASP